MATETFGERLRRLRMRDGISQDQIAEALRTSRQTVSNWENDKCAIDYFSLQDIKKILHATWDELMGEKKPTIHHEDYRQGVSLNEDTDYKKLRASQGHISLSTDLAELSKAGDYRITSEDIQIAYPTVYALPPHILAIASEAVRLGFTVLDVESRMIHIRLETDAKAVEFKKFLDAFNARGYEHAPRCQLFADKYYKKYFKAEGELMEEGIREIFNITADKILTIVSPGDGIVGYANSIEEAKKIAKKLGINNYSVYS